jgi:hypothetical protein
MARKDARSTATRSKAAATRSSTKSASRARTSTAGATKTPGISRIDQVSTRTHGFVVRLEYQRTATGWRPKFTAFFGDASHGGKDEALRAAESYVRKVKRSAKAGTKTTAKTAARR